MVFYLLFLLPAFCVAFVSPGSGPPSLRPATGLPTEVGPQRRRPAAAAAGSGLPTLPLGKVAETCHEFIIYSALKTLWEKHEY